ncbi:MAG: hypothetical protein A2Z21_03840 [Candidatus Fraserbacteria bacterium RBG_16_55_9]|uniref:DUF58 domain-containing protein n=1 Tax=Fraserbacteria sp. (strain RBG_16_55_9) TaxID=1817864 RepID=A0A1F5UX98_FRAXR|nr:MAG: hypothetical protein A2Z21_03840 [Candidatus Fraserbacteria bacterium RBG_16_55_9]
MRRLLLLSVVIFGLILLGLATRSGAWLALAIPLLVYLVSGFLYSPEALNVNAMRSLSADRITPNEPVTVTLSITNEGSHVEEIFIEDLVPSSLEVIEGEPKMLTSFPPGAKVELSYTVSGDRGYYRFPGIRVTAQDPFHLFRKQITLSAPGQLFVLPEVVRLKRVEIRPRRTRVYSGLIPTRQGGPGIEFYGVREYQAGDSLRTINWKASVRHPESLFINEFEQERVADVGLILDARLRSDVIAGESPLFEHAIQAAAALTDAFLSSGNRVGMLVYGGHLDWTFPGYGKIQREKILRALARAEQGESQVFEGLEYVPTRLFPARSQLVLISPLLEGDLAVLLKLRARGYPLLIISPDPISFEQKKLQGGKDIELAIRIARLERELLLRRLRQAGTRIVDWNVDTPFHQAVHSALSRSPLWFRALGGGP